MSSMNHETYTVKDVQQILRIGLVNAYKLVRTPDFLVIRIGRSYRIPKARFDEWLNSQPGPTDHS